MSARIQALSHSFRRPWKAAISALIVLLATGCSISSTPSNVDHMHCVKAHDEWHQTDGGSLQTICDLYAPDGGATP